LTPAERQLILDDVSELAAATEQVLARTPADEPVQMMLDEVFGLGCRIAVAMLDHSKLRQLPQLNAIMEKIADLLDHHAYDGPSADEDGDDDEPPLIDWGATAQGDVIAQYAQLMLLAAQQDGIEREPVTIPSAAWPRLDDVMLLHGLPDSLQKKFVNHAAVYNIADVANLLAALAENMRQAEAGRQCQLSQIAKELMISLSDNVEEIIAAPNPPPTRGKSKAKSPVKSSGKAKGNAKGKLKQSAANKAGQAAGETLFQLKITLRGSEPAIWRRIQLPDCTLADLHLLIQAAMGWDNDHLYEFEFRGERYTEPPPMGGGFGIFGGDDGADAKEMRLSDLLENVRKRTSFKYVYDFGDDWQHTITLEDRPPREPGKFYPLCLDGARACPPEDIGGVHGLDEILEAFKYADGEEDKQWLEERCGEDYDPAAFDADDTTAQMRFCAPQWQPF
jgi:hypothetical protein